jgi:hypothetical protein
MVGALVAVRHGQRPNINRAWRAFTHTRILGEDTATVKPLYSAIFCAWKDVVEDRKDRGEELVSAAAGPDLRTAMLTGPKACVAV